MPRKFTRATQPPHIKISFKRFLWVDPEAEDFDSVYEEEHGWIDEEGVEFEPDEYDIEEGMTGSESIVEQAVDFLKDNYAVNPTPGDQGFRLGISYYVDFEVVDYGPDGEEEQTYHLYGFTPEEEEAIWREVTSSRS
jgi:hypothetical protein